MLDFLTGRRNLDKIQRQGDKFARSMYDPSQADPMIDLGFSRASEGIDVDSLRQSLLSEVYRQRPSTQTGMSQGQQLGIHLAQEGGRSAAIATGETQIALADQEVKLQGEQTLAQGLSQRAQLRSQRDAAIAENRMMIEAESGRRRQQLLGGVLNLASAAINPSGIFKAREDLNRMTSTSPIKPTSSVNRILTTSASPNTLDTLQTAVDEFGSNLFFADRQLFQDRL